MAFGHIHIQIYNFLWLRQFVFLILAFKSIFRTGMYILAYPELLKLLTNSIIFVKHLEMHVI